MLDFNLIVDEIMSGATGAGRKPVGLSKTASRNHYEWSLAHGMRSGDRVRLADGRQGILTAPFPGCRGNGDWCGIFLDDGTEENIRPDRVASVFDKSAGWKPFGNRKAAEDGREVRYLVEFQGHGTNQMSARMTKGGDDEEPVTGGHERSSKLLQALVEFEVVGSGLGSRRSETAEDR